MVVVVGAGGVCVFVGRAKKWQGMPASALLLLFVVVLLGPCFPSTALITSLHQRPNPTRDIGNEIAAVAVVMEDVRRNITRDYRAVRGVQLYFELVTLERGIDSSGCTCLL